jgi:D-amino peptidase
MKLYIVADMEGISGVVAEDQITGNTSWDADRSRRQFTEEVCTVCEAALASGAEEIILNDFHGNGRNLLCERLPTQVFVIQGDFRPTSGFDMLDNTFQGFIFLGAHARTGSTEAVIPHTYTNQVRFEIFGQPVGELEILSLIAGEFNVPTILISGDQKTMQQARTNLPAAYSVITKYALNTRSALCFHPKNVLESLKDETTRAIANLHSIEPPTIVPPMQLTIRPATVRVAEDIEWIPGLKRLDDLTFQFQGENMVQIGKLIYGIATLAGAK